MVLGGLIHLNLAGVGLSKVTSAETTRVPCCWFLSFIYLLGGSQGTSPAEGKHWRLGARRAKQRAKPPVQVLSTALFVSHLLSSHWLTQVLWLSSSRKGKGLQGECQRVGDMWRVELELGNSPIVGRQQKWTTLNRNIWACVNSRFYCCSWCVVIYFDI